MKIFSLILIFNFLGHFVFAQSTSISGVINSYMEGIKQLNNYQLKVVLNSSFLPGDTVLIYQAQGATIVKANNNSFGDISNIGNAGNYEFSTIQAIDVQNSIITLSCPLQNTYDDSLFQLVKVRNYNNATVNGLLTCAPWDGKKGGILVLFVQGTLTLNNNIDVSAKGFRGAGTHVINTLNKCSNEGSIYGYHYTINGKDSAGMKGEGISRLQNMHARGRGKNANGGGGGNGINSGGGGGGNGGIGGSGGRESSMCLVSSNYGGIGGIQVPSNQVTAGERLYFGGGGGTGTFEQYPNDVSNGGNGGGIAIILANNIISSISSNYAIKSNGENVTYVTQNESAGGGGAGGTIVLISNNINGSLQLTANGGNGGSSSLTSCRGSGGGGGGGIIYHLNLPLLTVNANKGFAGNACNQYKGTDGTDGFVTNNFTLKINCLLNNNVIQANQQVCPNIQPNLLTGTVYPPGFSYKWQFKTDFSTWQDCSGTNDQPNYQPPPLTQTTYYRRMVMSFSGTSTITDSSNIVTITVAPLTTNISVVNVSCFGYQNGQIHTTVNGGTPPYSYLWSNGSTTPNLNNIPAGTYYLTITDSKGCQRMDTMIVTQPPPITVNINKQDVTCYGYANGSATATCAGGTPPYTYIWSNGITQPTITNLSAGTYYVTVNDINNCQAIAFINIQQPSQIIISSTIVRPTCVDSCNGSISLDLSGGTPPYQVSPSNLNNLCSGNYNITVTDNNNCTKTTTISLTPQTIIQNNIIQSSTTAQVCYQTNVTITGSNPTGSGMFNFLWQTSIDSIIWNNAPPINYHPNYNWYADQNRFFRRIVTGSGCSNISNVISFNVLKLNNQIFTNDSIYCQYDTIYPITGTIDTAYIYNWQYKTGGGAWIDLPDQTPNLFPSTAYQTASYRRIVQGYGCSDTSNIITINFVNISNTIKIDDSLYVKQYCQLAEGNISGYVNYSNVSVTWLSSQDSINWLALQDTSLSYYFYLTDYSNRYYYFSRVISQQGCFDTSNVVVVDLLPPVLNIIESSQGLSSVVEVCAGQMLALGSFINQPAGGNNQFDYIWIYHTDTTSWTNAPGVHNQKNYLTPVIWDTTYFARVIISGTCIDTSNIITVIPIILPPNEIQSVQTTYCYGQTIQPIEEQTSTQGLNVTYQWQMFSNNSWSNIPGATQATYLPNYIIGSTTYRRNIYKGNCSSTSNEITISCSPATTASIELLNNDSLCKSSNSVANIHVQINGNPPWNISYSVNGNIAVYTQHQSDSIVNISLQQNYYEIYLVQITDNSNCAIQVPTDTLRIWAFNPVSAHSSSMEICGLAATLQAQPPTEGIGRWILPPTMTCNNIHLYNAQVYSSLYGTFPIVWEVTNGPCIDTNQTTITFYEQPMQPYAGVDLTLYDANAVVVMSASMPTAGIGTWTVIQGQATFADVHHPNTQVTGFAEGDNLLRWIITNGICNPVYDDVLIRLFSIIVPEGFSPNGDGKNDYLEIKGIDGTIAYHLMVFNRWGNMVYESKQYQNNWNGKDNQGRDLPDDTYFYMLNRDDKLLKSGYLILKR